MKRHLAAILYADEFTRLRSEDSHELSELWEAAGVRVEDAPRNTTVSRKPAGARK